MEPQGISEEALFRRMAGGEAYAFETLYARLERPLMTLCAAILTRRDLAEEAMQEAWMELLRARHRWTQVRSPRAYLFQIARREALSLRGKEAGFAVPASDVLPLVEAEAGADDQTLARREAMEAALRKLPEAQREVVVMKHLSGLTLAEAAEIIGENPKTVESRYAAGMARLREYLGEAS